MITVNEKTELGALIAEAMNACGSDKESSHCYSEGYSYLINKVLGRTPVNLLEIGIANVSPDNSSLHGWSSVFPDTKIYGIDIDPVKMVSNDRINTFTLDQSDTVQLSNFKKNLGEIRFDIILDDGSHVFNHAETSFRMLFSRLSNNGLYMIEDVGKSNIWGQSVDQWSGLLSSIDKIDYEIIDCKPSEPNDDSILIGVWNKSGEV